MKRKIQLILLCCFLFSGIACPQQEDFRTLFSVELEGELFDYIDYSLTPEVRLMDYSSKMESLLGELDVSAPLTKFFRLGIEYRYELDYNEDKSADRINRYGVYAELDEKIEYLRMEYRALYLQEYRDFNTSELGRIPEAVHRHRIRLRYRRKGWDVAPFLALEAFFTLQPAWQRNRQKYRLSSGVRIRLTKDINLGIQYKYQKEFNQNNPLTAHIISTGIEFEL